MVTGKAESGVSVLAFRKTELGGAGFFEVEVEAPGPGCVQIDVLAAGICHSDLHVLDGGVSGAWNPEFTLGHEICGRVSALGAGVSGVGIGDQVAVYAPLGCGRCTRCAAGLHNYCERRSGLRAVGLGLGVDGGMTSRMVVDAWRLVPAPGIDPASAAVLTDAGLTSYHAISGSKGKLRDSGAVAVVLGIGGLGHLAIQILRATTAARVIGVDTRPAALDLGTRCGADITCLPADLARELRRLSPGHDADVIFDFVATQDTIELAKQLVRPAGDLVIVGGGRGTLAVTKPGALPAGLAIRLPFWGSPAELREVVEVCRSGAIEAYVRPFRLDQAPAALDALRGGEISGRAVLLSDAV